MFGSIRIAYRVGDTIVDLRAGRNTPATILEVEYRSKGFWGNRCDPWYLITTPYHTDWIEAKLAGTFYGF
jgi:hypothetical protein